MKRVTLSDVAMRLGISKFSVSRALTGQPGVSDATRREVRAVARELGYRHASLERVEGRPRGRSVVLLIPLQDVEDVEFWMGAVSGASSEANALGYTFVTQPLDTTVDQAKAPTADVAGVIVAGSYARAGLGPYVDAGVPVSLLTYASPLEPFDSVHAADWEGGVSVTEHLVALGHTRLAYVTDRPEKPSFAARARGFGDAAVKAGLDGIDEFHVDPDEPGLSFERAYRALAVAGRGPTGILTSTDGIAFSVVSALSRLGVRVPADVSVVGFNDAAASSRHVPKLTTLNVPTRSLGAVAMRFLHERIEGATMPPRRLELAPTFVQRESTDTPRAPLVELAAEEANPMSVGSARP